MDPLPPIAFAGMIVTAALSAWRGERWIFVGLAVGIALAVLVWLAAVGWGIATEGLSPATRFTIGGGLVMGVGLASAAWIAGGVVGGLLGVALRFVAQRLLSLRD